MTTTLAILGRQILAGWLFDHRFTRHGGGVEIAWETALAPLVPLAAVAVPGLVVAWATPRVPAQGGPKFTAKLLVGHLANLADLWRDVPLRRASFVGAFLCGLATSVHLGSVKLAKSLTGRKFSRSPQHSVFALKSASSA